MTDNIYLRYLIPVVAARTTFFFFCLFLIPTDLSVISTAAKNLDVSKISNFAKLGFSML